jgi:xanthine dehydrogenase small subunit
MTGATLRQHQLLVNGESLSADGFPTQTTLLDFLRDHGLTGAKEGCAEGECGACTVLMVSADGPNRSAYKAVNSCLMFLPAAVDREFYTVESLAQNGKLAGCNLTEVQQAMATGGGSQCGYCTPGFVMSLFAEQYRPGRTGPCDPRAMGGNLCRCTGYRPIRDAALSIGPPPEGFFLDRLSKPEPHLSTVHYPNAYDRPANLAECLDIAARHPQAKWICGATDLAVESNLKFHRWPHLISVEAVAALQEFEDTPASVRIGAALPLSEIERQWTTAPQAVADWVRLFASPTIRNRATLGGNLATASPIGDSAPLLMALNANLHLASIHGNRSVPMSSFFTGYRKTRLEEAELIRSIEITKPFPAFTRFYKASKRRMDDISTVAAGFSMDWDSSGRISRARFAFGGVGPATLRVSRAEDAAVGQPWNESTVERIQRELDRALHPIDDHRGSAEYRLAVAKSFVEKFYWDWREQS